MTATALLQAQRIRSGSEACSSQRGPSRRPFCPASLPARSVQRQRAARVAASQPGQDVRWPQPSSDQPEDAAAAPPAAVIAMLPPAAASIANGSGTGSMDESDVLIEFRDVHKSFGSKHILRGASFKIRRGEAVGIIGSSGTGKSTTLRLAAGLLEPDKGEVLIKGEARRGLLSDDDTSNKLKVGLVFQSGALFDSLTVRENVGFMLYEHSALSPERIEAAVADSLAKVGLSGVEALYPSELSGGMKKRCALARAIVKDLQAPPGTAEELIMYDEPTAGLDPVASTVIEDLIRSMHEPPVSAAAPANGAHRRPRRHNTTRPSGGITSYVVVTHQHSTIRRAVDRIIFLHAGAVVWEGSVQEFDTTDEPIVRQFAAGSLDGPIVYL